MPIDIDVWAQSRASDGEALALLSGQVAGREDATAAELAAHESDDGNPHNVTAAQVGAPTTSDLADHESATTSVHGIPDTSTLLTEADIGGSVVYDPATGRLAIGGMEMGRTGWRDITGSLINGWTADQVIIMRAAGMVQLAVAGLTGTSASSPQFLSLPGGFAWSGSAHNNARPRGVIVEAGTGAPGGTRRDMTIAGSAGDQVRAETDTVGGNGGIVFATMTAWPSSWPGTPL